MINRDQTDGEPTLEEQAEIEAAIAEADLGGGVPAEEVLRELRVRSGEEYDLTEEQEAEIEASIAEFERGESIDGDEIIRELRRRCGLS